VKAWLTVCGVLGGVSLVVAWSTGIASPVQELTAHPLAWNAHDWISRPWTLWTSAWVHTSGGSLSGNLLALIALAVLGAALGAGRAAAAALWIAWPLSTLALLLWPEVASYGGLGGPIHAAAAVLGAHLARSAASRPLSYLLFGAMGLKVLAERGWAQPVAFDPSWGFNVIYAAHLTGMACGAACGWISAALVGTPAPGARDLRG
jgi:hypothetical protein